MFVMIHFRIHNKKYSKNVFWVHLEVWVSDHGRLKVESAVAQVNQDVGTADRRRRTPENFT